MKREVVATSPKGRDQERTANNRNSPKKKKERDCTWFKVTRVNY